MYSQGPRVKVVRLPVHVYGVDYEVQLLASASQSCPLHSFASRFSSSYSSLRRGLYICIYLYACFARRDLSDSQTIYYALARVAGDKKNSKISVFGDVAPLLYVAKRSAESVFIMKVTS